AREGVAPRTVSLDVGAARAAEELRRARRLVVPALQPDHRVGEARDRRWAVVVGAFQRARLHLLEAERERTFDGAAIDRLAREEQRARPGRAIVVEVEDRDAGEAYAVHRRLPRGGVA